MADGAPETKPAKGLGLSTKLLGLTILFVLIAEVLIYIPSVANFRVNWLRDRLVAAQTAAFVIDAAPDGMIPRQLERDVLAQIGAMTISTRVGDTRRLLAFSDMPPPIVATYDLREPAPIGMILEAFDTLLAPDGRTVRVIGAPPTPMGADFIEIVMDETPLKQALWRFSLNITFLSLFISALTATLVYLALHWLFVRPMRRVHGAMMHFRAAPEAASSIVVPSGRRDEIGQAETELARLQTELQGMLQQKTHLANLGLAVAKINHDLRNILASAQLFSDRLASVPDPTVQRLVPKVISALDRAIALCRDTLAYGKATEPQPNRRAVALRGLVDEVATVLALAPDGPIAWRNRVERGVEIDADPEHLFRILMNLVRNSAQALEAAPAEESAPRREIAISARREGSVTVIEVADSGPGVPEAVRATLFQPFATTTRKGGSGLGLAIAAELVKGHGGDITLADGTLGATFLVSIPDRPIDLSLRRAERARA
jgi:signal transduction histidine kinase